MKQRIIATVLAVVLVVVSISAVSVDCMANVKAQNIDDTLGTVYVYVIDADGQPITSDVNFYEKESGSLIPVNGSEDGKYSLDISDCPLEGFGLDIIVRLGGYDIDISKEITVMSDETDYTADMSMYLPLEINEQMLSVDEATGTYKHIIEYSDNSKIIIGSEFALYNVRGGTWEPGIEFSEPGTLKYTGAGTITADVTYIGEDVHNIYKSGHLMVNVLNPIKFEISSNSNLGEGVTVEADLNDTALVGTVMVENASENNWNKKLVATYDEQYEIAYKIDNGVNHCFSINSSDGSITFNPEVLSGDEQAEATVTAYYVGHEDVKASYELVYRMGTENIEATLGEFQDNEAHVEYKQGEKEN